MPRGREMLLSYGITHHAKVRNTSTRGLTSSCTALRPRRTTASWSHSYPKTACPPTPPKASWPTSSSPQHCPAPHLPLPTPSQAEGANKKPSHDSVPPASGGRHCGGPAAAMLPHARPDCTPRHPATAHSIRHSHPSPNLPQFSWDPSSAVDNSTPSTSLACLQLAFSLLTIF